MTTILVVVVYLIVGLAWARSQAVRLQKRINRARNHYRECDGYRRGSCCSHDEPWFSLPGTTYEQDLHIGLLVHAIGWPVLAPPRIALWLVAHTAAAPIKNRREEVRQLKIRRAYWESVPHEPGLIYTADAIEAMIAEIDVRIKEREV